MKEIIQEHKDPSAEINNLLYPLLAHMVHFFIDSFEIVVGKNTIQ